MSTEAIFSGLNPKLTRILQADQFLRHQTLDPRILLTPHRFDVFIKLRVIALMERGLEGLAKDVYLKHIFSINRFHEADDSGKVGPIRFWHSFTELCESFRKDGFDRRKSVLPITSRNEIIDGSHRLALAVYFQRPVPVAVFDYSTPVRLDAFHFQRERLSEDVMVEGLKEMSLRLPSMKGFLLWPKGLEKLSSNPEAEKHLDALRIVFRKKVPLSKTGLHNLVAEVYASEPWVGTLVDNFASAQKKSTACWSDSFPMAELIVVDHAEDLQESKRLIRNLLEADNHSLHSFDDQKNLIRAIGILLNSRSVSAMNECDPDSLNVDFKRSLSLFKKEVETKEGEPIALTSSVVPYLLGGREPADLDFISLRPHLKMSHPSFSNHFGQQSHYPCSFKEILHDPGKRFHLFGLEFVSLPIVMAMKERRGEKKDWLDVIRMKSREKRHWAGMSKAMVRMGMNTFRKLVLERRRRLLHRTLYSVFSVIPGPHRLYRYAGYWGICAKDDSLATRIKNGGTFEQPICREILRHLKAERDVFIDIGANIGLVALYIHRHFPQGRILAFEPGPTQYGYFRKTLRLNRIRAVDLRNVALDESEGWRDFFVHKPGDTSGDGFQDTGRAGETRRIRVRTVRLDDESHDFEEERYRVKVIKIDTEGAELHVLRGSRRLLEQHRPVLVFECWPENIAKFDYRVEDIFGFLEEIGYEWRSLNQDPLDLSGVLERFGKEDTFVAVPVRILK